MSRRYLRPGVVVGHVIVLAIALACLRLGWWQWDVAHESRGTIQNLGYALLWPVFAGSFIYMWLRFLQLEAEQVGDGAPRGPGAGQGSRGPVPDGPMPDGPGFSEPESDGPGRDGPATNRPAPGRTAGGREHRHTRVAHPRTEVRLTGIGMIDAAADDDAELAAYNRALARLAEQDDDRAR